MILTVKAPHLPKAFDQEEVINLIGNKDPLVWAETFVGMYEANEFEGGITVDLMLTWFANCMGTR